MKLESYWLDTAPGFTEAAQGPVLGRADVVVVGAGFTGLSAALALARCGASVTVLESNRIVGEASGRNGGHCNSGLAHDFASLAGRIGLEQARAFYRAYNAAVDTVETVIGRENIDCDFVRAGKLKLAAKPEHYNKLVRACLGSFIIGTEPLDDALLNRLLRTVARTRRRRTSATTFAFRRTTVCCSAVVHASRCRIRARTKKAAASCVRRWRPPSPNCGG